MVILVVIIVHAVLEPGLVDFRIQFGGRQVVVHGHADVASTFVHLSALKKGAVVQRVVFDGLRVVDYG